MGWALGSLKEAVEVSAEPDCRRAAEQDDVTKFTGGKRAYDFANGKPRGEFMPLFCEYASNEEAFQRMRRERWQRMRRTILR
jgi:hypothetical protein